MVTVRGYDGEPLPDDEWIEVTGRFDQRLTSQEPQEPDRRPDAGTRYGVAAPRR
jgi:hypothetical protein